jgi:hypothetical protein
MAVAFLRNVLPLFIGFAIASPASLFAQGTTLSQRTSDGHDSRRLDRTGRRRPGEIFFA